MRWILATVLLCAGFGLFAEDAKAPVPDAAKIKDAEATIKDLFKEEYAKPGAEDRKALGQKLLQQGLDTKDDPVSRYVLYKEAAALAVAVGDVDTAAKSLDALGRNYEVDVAALKLDAFAKFAPANVEAAKALVRMYLKAIDDAVAADSYDTALKIGLAADAVARKAQDLPLVTQLAARNRDVRSLQADFLKVKAAQATLKEKPDDPAANLAVGKFTCFTKGEWEKGLPLLAKGSEARLKELAEQELAAPTEAKEQLALADAWWDLSEKTTGAAKIQLQIHAGGYYVKADSGLSGLVKTRVEKRLLAVEQLLGPVDLLKTLELAGNSVAGSFKIRDGALVTSKGPNDRIQVPLKHFKSKSYEITCVVEKRESGHAGKEEGLWLGFPIAGKQVTIFFGGTKGEISGIEMLDGKRMWENASTKSGLQFPFKEERRIVIQVGDNRIAATNNGAKVIEWEGKPDRLAEFSDQKVPNPHALVIGTWWTEYIIKELTIAPR